MLSQGVDEKLVAEQSGDRLDTNLKYYYKYISRPDEKKSFKKHWIASGAINKKWSQDGHTL